MDISHITKEDLEAILVCPQTGEELMALTSEELALLNEKINQGEIKRCDGHAHNTSVQAAFKAKGYSLFYPVEDDIIYLLPEASLVGEEANVKLFSTLPTQKEVKRFYDEIGWEQREGIYKDSKDSEDLREVSREYIERCHLRINQYLPKMGKYLLDVASGPLQYPAYLTYSNHFQYRICADISLTALKEAKKKLGPKGIYLLSDVTRLPLKDNIVNAVISLHTIYHVPKELQLKAFSEIHRVLTPGGVSAIVYSWGRNSLLMNLFLFPWKLIALLKKSCSPSLKAPLYCYSFNYGWFLREIKSQYRTRLFSWRSVSVPFLQKYIHQFLGGSYILKTLFALESRFHQFFGRVGAYPLFVTKK